MNELVTYETYEQFKVALDTEILSAAESFVKIGYLLKQARDTTILHDSGYANLYEFAKAEYGIDKGTVSRYIAINDRFSIGGNAPALEDKYSGRGVAKLQEMLTMSDEVIDVIPEQTTKAEIQDIKRDIKAEEEKTDIEVLMEDRGLNVSAEDIELNTLTRQAMYYHLKSDKEAFARLCEVFKASEGGEDIREEVMKALAPSGVATPRTRVPGVGTILLSIQGIDHDIQFVNVRSNEKESQAWLYIQDMLFAWFGLAIRTGQSAAGRYEEFYGEEFEEVAPVQPEIEQPKAEDVQEPKENVQEVEENAHEVKESAQKVEKAWGVGTLREEGEDEPRTETEDAEETEENAEAVEQAEPDIRLQRDEDLERAGESETESRGNSENTVVEAEIVENVNNVDKMTGFDAMNEPEKPENIIEAEFREVENSYSVTSEQHNTFMKIAEDIKKALFMQDYEFARFKAQKLAEILDFSEDNEDE